MGGGGPDCVWERPRDLPKSRIIGSVVLRTQTAPRAGALHRRHDQGATTRSPRAISPAATTHHEPPSALRADARAHRIGPPSAPPRRRASLDGGGPRAARGLAAEAVHLPAGEARDGEHPLRRGLRGRLHGLAADGGELQARLEVEDAGDDQRRELAEAEPRDGLGRGRGSAVHPAPAPSLPDRTPQQECLIRGGGAAERPTNASPQAAQVGRVRGHCLT